MMDASKGKKLTHCVIITLLVGGIFLTQKTKTEIAILFAWGTNGRKTVEPFCIINYVFRRSNNSNGMLTDYRCDIRVLSRNSIKSIFPTIVVLSVR